MRFFAKKFAHLLLCAQPETGRACAECKQCVLSASNQHPDLLQIRPEGTSGRQVEQIREAFEFLSMTSHAGGPKIVIIEQSHQMNANAANALLKTLEDSNPDSYLLLVTESVSSMMKLQSGRAVSVCNSRFLVLTSRWSGCKDSF